MATTHKKTERLPRHPDSFGHPERCTTCDGYGQVGLDRQGRRPPRDEVCYLCGGAGIRTGDRMPGFRAQTGREAVAGKDYSPDGDFSQDEYEYFTGTGSYY